MLSRVIRAGALPNPPGIFLNGNLLAVGDSASPIVLTAASAITKGKRRSYTLSGAISGAYPLTLAPSAGTTIVLTGANTWSGGTTVSRGTVQVGNGGASGAIAGAVLNNSKYVVNLSTAYSTASYGGALTGSGAASFLSGSNLTINANAVQGAMSFAASGQITINSNTLTASTLTLSSTGRMNTSTGTATLAGAVTMTSGGGFYLPANLAVGALGTVSVINIGGGFALGNGTYGLASQSSAVGISTLGTVTINVTYTGAGAGGGAVGFGGALTNTGGSLTINADATGSNARTGWDGGVNNVYAAPIQVAGTINIVATAPATATNGDAAFAGVVSTANATVTVTGTRKGIQLVGGASETAGTLNLSMINTSSSAAISTTAYASNFALSGTLLLKSAGTLDITQGVGQIYAAGGLTIDNAGAADTISSNIVNKSVSLPTSLTKKGVGTLKLTSGSSTYSGPTSIIAGTLAVQGASASSAHTVSGGAAISAGAVTSGSVGALTFAAASAALTVNAITSASASKLSCGALTASSGFTVNVLGAMSAGTYPVLVSTSGTAIPTLGTNTSGRSVTFAWSGQTLNMTLS